jgi:hypothetical protein
MGAHQMASAMADWGFHPMLVWTSLALVMLSACSQEPAKQKSGGAEEMASSHSLSFFADEQDARILLGRLNADPEIAFIVPDGPRMPPPNERMPASPPRGDRPPTGLVLEVARCGWGWDGYWQRWRALRPVDSLRDGEHILWHISAGPLLISDDGPGRRGWRPDPWVGWTSERPICEPNLMPAAIIRLKLATRYAAYTPQERTTLRPLISYWIKGDGLVASSFQWSGASLQPGGSLQTARWVAGLEDWFSRNAVGLHAVAPDGRRLTEIFWAFPSALQRLKSGMPYDSRGYPLDESIRQAR